MSIGIVGLGSKITGVFLSHSQIISAEVFEKDSKTLDNIYTMFQPNNITKLKVVIKPVVIDNLEEYEKCHVLATTSKGQYLVFPDSDISAIRSLGRSLCLDEIELYSTVISHVVEENGSQVFIDETLDSKLSLFHYLDGKLHEIVVSSPQALKDNCNNFVIRYPDTKFINASSGVIKSVQLSKVLLNYNTLSHEDKEILSSVLVVELESPAHILSTNGESETQTDIDGKNLGKSFRVRKEESIEKVLRRQRDKEEKRLREEEKQDIDDYSYIAENSDSRFASRVLFISLVLFSVIFGVQASMIIQMPDEYDKLNAKSIEDSLMTSYMLSYNDYLDKALTSLRTGSNYYSNKVKSILDIEFSGVITSIDFDKARYVVYGMAESQRDVEKLGSQLTDIGDIMNISISGEEILDNKKYPLFSITLK